MTPPSAPATPSPTQVVATTLVKEPLMITLPLAYLVSLVFWQVPGGDWSKSNWGAFVAALVVSLLIYLADLSTQKLPWHKRVPENERLSWDGVLFRLVYVLINTGVLVGLLTGIATLGDVGTGG
jgi:hypothetical protein